MSQRCAYSLWLCTAFVLALVHCGNERALTAPGVVSVSLNPTSATLRLGTVLQLTPTVTVDGLVAARALSYASSDPSVVSITSGGLLRAMSTGNATISAVAGSVTSQALVTVIAGLPASVIKTAGDDQTSAAGTAVAIPPSVVVRDSANNPVSGIIVTFSGTGVVVGAAATTNAAGVAAVKSWSLLDAGGGNYLTATVPGLDYVVFHATGTSGAIGLNATTIAASTAVGSTSEIDRIVNVTNAGTGTLTGLELGPVAYVGTPGWLTAVMDGVAAPTTVRLVVNPVGLQVGTYVATVPVLSASASNGSQSFTFTLKITRAVTSTTLSSSANPSVLGQAVTLTATVAAAGVVPGGSVQFKDGGVALGAPVPISESGSALLVTSALSMTGSPHSLTAEYSGDGLTAPSTSATLRQVVGVATTAVSLAASPTTVTFGSPITLTATVNGSSATPTGVVQFRDGATVLGAATLDRGVATLTTSVLSIGGSPHSVTAAYSGDANNGISASAAAKLTVTSGAPSVATLASSGSPSVFGQPVTLTATMTGPGGTPSGTVTFKDGTVILGTAALNGSGVAVLAVSLLGVVGGPHAVIAVYPGDATYAASASAAIAHVVATATTTTALVSSATSAAPGAGLALTATVTTAFGTTPSGSVTFTDGSTTLGTAALSGGIASLATSALSSTGLHTIRAAFAGDASHLASTSGPVSLAVSVSPTTTAVVSSANPSTFGQSVTFIATVTATGGTPTGTVQFKDGGTNIGGPASVSAGVATITTSTLSAAGSPHAITAVYSGDASNATSTSAALSEVVSRAAATITLTSSANPSAFGSAVTFTATVASGSGTPTGTVEFKDGATSLGLATVSAGVATLTTSALSVAGSPHAITAVYGGDASYLTVTSSAVSQVVTSAATTTSLASSVNPTSAGQPVTFTATVAGGSGSPTGTVQFKDGGTNMGGPAAVSAGVATITTSTLTAAGSPHAITAVYSGDASNATSTSAALSQVVSRAAATIALASSANPSAFGSAVTFTATVASGSGTPTGTVEFKDGATSLGLATVSAGVATLTTSALSVAGSPHAITAVYGGDASYLTVTSSAVSQVVTSAATTTSLASSVNLSVVGQAATFTATVSAASGTPTGNVTFMDGATTLGSGALGAGGVATFTTSALSTGTHSISAVYAGDASHATSSSSAISQAVVLSASSVTLVSSANPAESGTTITFTASVTGAGTPPTGTVTFMDGGATLGSASVIGGSASFSTSSLTATGSPHAMSATYNGDGTYAASISSAFSQVVSKATTSVALSSSRNPTTAGQSVTFTAVVSGGGAVATGTVTFFDSGVALGTSSLTAGTATLATSSLGAAGSPHSITAVYNGDASHDGSSSAVLSQRVNGAVTSVAVASSSSPSRVGVLVTFTAIVAGGETTPTGTVQFKDGGINLGSPQAIAGSGQATFATSTLSVAGSPHAITATYSGDAEHLAATSAAIAQVIDRTSTTTTVSSSNSAPPIGQSLTFTATVNGDVGSPTGTVQFKDAGVNLGAPMTLSAGTALLTTSSLSAGAHLITAVYNGDATYLASTSPALGQSVGKGTPVNTLSITAVGLSVTLTARIAGEASVAPTGSVTFKDGSTALGPPVRIVGGVATLTPSLWRPEGSHAITAVYGGDTNYSALTSATLNFAVLETSITLARTSGANPAPAGSPVTFSATVTAADGSTLPTGTVQFRDNGVNLGAPVLLSGGVATFTTSTLSAHGVHSITAAYGGSSNLQQSVSPSVAQTVTPTP